MKKETSHPIKKKKPSIRKKRTSGKGGRPPTEVEQLETILQKLRPHLEGGLSVTKSCVLAGVAESSIYEHMKNHKWFLERIEAFKTYQSKALSNIFTWRIRNIKENIEYIEERSKDGTDKFTQQIENYKLMPKQEDWQFLQWFAQNSRSVREEYSSRSELTGRDGAPLIPQKELSEESANDIVSRINEQLDTMRGNNNDQSTTELPTEPIGEIGIIANGSDPVITTDDTAGVSTGAFDVGQESYEDIEADLVEALSKS